MNPTVLVFFGYFCLVLAISYLSYQRSSKADDYVTGGRNFSPRTVALSAGAADNSGWLLLAVPGLAYNSLPSALWLMLLLLIGSYLSWTYLAPYLRNYVENAPRVLTLPDLFEHRFKGQGMPVRGVASFIMVLFSTAYAAANITAGGVLFNEIFKIDYSSGVLLVFVFVLIITSLGGFTAVCWLDVFQASLMLCALLTVPSFVLYNLGQANSLGLINQELGNQFLDFINPESGVTAGGIIFSLSIGLGWGLGYFGQPHILARYMVINNASGLPKAKRFALTWYFLCLTGAVTTGFFGFIFFSQRLADPELIFLELAETLFHSVIAGIIYASVWAAIMSTVNAQLMVSGNIMANDVCFQLAARFNIKSAKSERVKNLLSRLIVVTVLIIAALLAANLRQTVMVFVSYAWAGLGASFSPILISLSFGWRVTAKAAVACMISGTTVVILWSLSGLYLYLYEMVAGFVVSFTVLRLLSKEPKNNSKKPARNIRQNKN